MAKLGLGTAQFGLDYGISNRGGMTPPAEAGRILEAAARAGVLYLDTAPVYGESEQVLGRFGNLLKGFRVVTKTPVLANGAEPARALPAAFGASLERMHLTSCYGLLVHQAEELLSPAGEEIFDALRELKESGAVSKIGVSVYTAHEIEEIAMRFAMDLIQVPVSIFDQRLILSGHLQKLHAAGVEVHARSVFLQGALLMDPSVLPSKFDSARTEIKVYRAEIERRGLRPLEAALGFALGLECVDCVVCGVNTLAQLRDILTSAVPLPSRDFAEFALSGDGILNPTYWSRA